MTDEIHHQVSIHPAPHKDYPNEQKLIVEMVKLIESNEIGSVNVGARIAFRLYNNSTGWATFAVYKKVDGVYEPNPSPDLFGGDGTITLTPAVPHVTKTVAESAKGHEFRFQRKPENSASEEGHGPVGGMTGTIYVTPGR